MENNQLYGAETQQLQMLGQNTLAQRNMVTSGLSEQIPNHTSRSNGGGGSSAGRLIRGTQGGGTSRWPRRSLP